MFLGKLEVHDMFLQAGKKISIPITNQKCNIKYFILLFTGTCREYARPTAKVQAAKILHALRMSYK